MRKFFRRFTNNKPWVTTIEYGLIFAGVGVAVMTLVNQVGTDLQTVFVAAGMGLR